MENVKKINDELTVAGQVTPEQLKQAAHEGFKSVLNLRAPDEKGFLSDEQQQAEAAGLCYVNIPVKLEEISDELIHEVLRQIDKLPKPALVHCASAMRAVVITLMNIAIWQGMTPQQAFEKAAEIGFDLNAQPQIKQLFDRYVSEYLKAT
ncbi:beta-lactamase hydrolase domain-containing protein [Nostoc favosum]|uniref:Protein tyrosine phosphatase family protein n=1 Tax=Nostoc favosum CHAB5714 TaxID=2780399 RepID=A0ABS8ICK0_9NOSO|nr:protein tyrosine phosphatase family protein [Nostoc favosum]MCC5601899.1 protein tyrosine phosphatase family protein [Nostoc favosum CHAB5714]